MSTPANTPAPLVKTSVAAAKGFELYAARHGDAAARLCCYGRLSHMGFLYFAGDVARLEKDLADKPW
jgi:hypothetical protein